MAAVPAGLVQSLVVKAQRRMLDEIGRAVGTPVVYLKAAWAEPVLYGGRGERMGGDIDVLVRGRAAAAFATALEQRGFTFHCPRWSRATHFLRNHAWAYMGPRGQLPVDLHLGLTEPPFFRMDVEECLDRVTAYDSVDGPILSLCPEDQVIYAAAHYANHNFDLDGRHLADVERLCRQRPIDWEAVWPRARRFRLDLAVALVAETLAARGVPVSLAGCPRGLGFSLRLARTRRWVATVPELRRTVPPSRVADKLLRIPFVSGRPAALPLYVLRHGAIQILDVAAGLLDPGVAHTDVRKKTDMGKR